MKPEDDVLEGKRLKWDKRFLELAEHVAQWSKDPSTKVGAIIADRNNRIISQGYNGFPSRLPDDLEQLNNREIKYKYTVHAEVNAILHAHTSLIGCSIYVWPLLPCVDKCAPIIIQSGLSRVVSLAKPPKRPEGSKYVDFSESIDVLKRAGLMVHLI